MLAQTPLASSLISAARIMSLQSLRLFLPLWRLTLCLTLASDIEKYKDLALHVEEGFPAIELVYLYGQPIVNRTEGLAWPLRLPDLPRLASICETQFKWASTSRLGAIFCAHIWRGFAIRQLIQVRLSNSQ